MRGELSSRGLDNPSAEGVLENTLSSFRLVAAGRFSVSREWLVHRAHPLLGVAAASLRIERPLRRAKGRWLGPLARRWSFAALRRVPTT